MNIVELCNRVFPNSETGCWEWKGAHNRWGYGTVFYRKTRWATHRLSFYLATGVHPRDLHVCHTCDNPPCCNPSHLFLGTQKDNVRDCHEKGRRPINRAMGSKNGVAVLTPELVRMIRKSTKPHKALARELGVNDRTIRHVRSGYIWRHVL